VGIFLAVVVLFVILFVFSSLESPFTGFFVFEPKESANLFQEDKPPDNEPLDEGGDYNKTLANRTGG